ncbi:hypothetical protein HY025_05040 [Candidatus Daviesbacteria bacterium]|nr:hypothetical protein [Candidatus Daviesbacteria bacterium]
MRQCSRCKKHKFLNEFNFKDKAKGLRQYHCKECSRLYVQSHYKRNRQYYIRKAKIRNEKTRKVIKDFVWNYLSKHACVDCGEKDPIVLEFDHIRDKSFTISSAGRDRLLEDVIREIKKCEVRCANCHRRKTAKQFGWDKKALPL